jgi:hypothetical protein
MMRFLADGAAIFALGTVLQPETLPPALEPEAPNKFTDPRASGVMRVVAAEAIVRSIIPLLSFTDFLDRISASDGHFIPPFVCAPKDLRRLYTILLRCLWTLGQNLPTSVCFSFLQNLCRNECMTRPIGHPCGLENTVQATIVLRNTNAGFVLHTCVTVHNISSLLLNPHQETNIIFTRQGKSRQMDLELRDWSQTNFYIFETNIGSQRPNITRHKFLHSVPTSDIFGGPNESTIA